jgi:hypothetical protein
MYVHTDILNFLIAERLEGDTDHLSVRVYYGPTAVACDARA